MVSRMTQAPSPAPHPAHRATVFDRIRQRLPRLSAPADANRTWSIVAHFGGAAGMLITFGVGGWIAPLIVLLARGRQEPSVRAHAIGALNFQLVWSAIGVLAWLVAWRPPVFVPLLAVTAVGVVFGVIGGLRANNGTVYAYPMSPRLVR
jgi:uncharacterized Tic20 family protein